MITRAQIIDEARSWIDTPYHHQARTKGIGCDCGGLIGGIAVACGVVGRDWWRTFDERFAGYGRQPFDDMLRAVCDSFMMPSEESLPGDVLLMRFDREPQHLGIAVPYRHGGMSLIHALAAAGRVVEHRLSPDWRRRIVGTYRMPGVH